ncbi:transmembrane protein 238-like [Cottoperca gobio]|uniref:Transmembrane protein 238-like n=1 Tax=Cottoperca gobio TaxID=56716 RepID=A0A6J2PBJ2_COTGO|nr:transmembrane protein 238-like [Cottoperca gobio]
MSTPEPVLERRYEGVGRCKCSFWFAVAHDVFGVFLMMVGVFGGLVVHDLFIYAGAIVIFLSLIWWVFWYSGNIDVPPEELEDDVGLIKLKNRGLSGAVRHMSDRFSSRIRSSFRKTGTSIRGDPTSNNRPSNTEVSLSTICDSSFASPAGELFEAVLQHGLRKSRGLALTAAALKQAAGFSTKTEAGTTKSKQQRRAEC